ncbi:MAG: hypothetical protein V2G51_07760, partial [bacterium JZ-2024 1]
LLWLITFIAAYFALYYQIIKLPLAESTDTVERPLLILRKVVKYDKIDRVILRMDETRKVFVNEQFFQEITPAAAAQAMFLASWLCMYPNSYKELRHNLPVRTPEIHLYIRPGIYSRNFTAKGYDSVKDLETAGAFKLIHRITQILISKENAVQRRHSTARSE